MSYNKIMIGKIRNVDYKKGIGEIIAANGEGFLFTIDDINSKSDLAKGDMVKFRAEQIHDVNKAYFVNKIDKEYRHISYNMQVDKKYTLRKE